jgi:hypothetical protein
LILARRATISNKAFPSATQDWSKSCTSSQMNYESSHLNVELHGRQPQEERPFRLSRFRAALKLALKFLPRFFHLRCCRISQVHPCFCGSLENECVGALAALQCSARYLALRVLMSGIYSKNIKPDLNSKRGSKRECRWPVELSNSQGHLHLAMKPRP